MESEIVSSLIGPYQPKEIVAVYAEQNTGKTVFLMQEVAKAISEGIRVLWLDTENGFGYGTSDGIWGAWKERFENRYGIKDMSGGVTYKNVLGYVELMKYLGWKVEIQYGDNKMAVVLLGQIEGDKKKEETVYGTFGAKRDKCLIVLDSLSSVFRLQFGSTLQNFPSRGDATAYLLFALNQLAERTNAPILTSNHASVNPTNQWATASIRGGSTVAYYSKNILYLERPKRKALENYRVIHAVRSPKFKAWEAKAWAKLDETGYSSVTRDEVEEVIKKAKEAKDELKT